MKKYQMKNALHISRWLTSPARKGLVFDIRLLQWGDLSREKILTISLVAAIRTDILERGKSIAVNMIRSEIILGMQFPQEFSDLACRLVGKPDALKYKEPFGVSNQAWARKIRYLSERIIQ